MTTHEVTVFCRATLNYVPRAGRGAGGGATEVAIRDGRQAALPGWEECGFELRRHESAVRDWSDDDHIADVHYPELEALARELSGCDHALVSGHIKRGPEHAARHKDLNPIRLVHSDFAASYGDKVRDRYHRTGPGAERALKRAGIDAGAVDSARRMLILQFWRNIGPAKMDWPLGFCDARTVAPDGVRAFPVTNYAGGGFNFEALGVLAPENPSEHEWYTFPEMAPDEVVAFRTFDTDRLESGQPFWTPHSAFRDPDVPEGQPSRSSIELRATCLFV